MAYSAARAAIDPSLDSLRKIKDREFTTNWSNHDLYNKKRSDEEQHKILNVLHENRGEEPRTFEEHKKAFQGNNKFFNKLLTIRKQKRLKSKLSDKSKATEAPKVQKRKRTPSVIEDQPMTSQSARVLEEKAYNEYKREEERRKQPKKKVKIYETRQNKHQLFDASDPENNLIFAGS